jgi:hypothetical protein
MGNAELQERASFSTAVLHVVLAFLDEIGEPIESNTRICCFFSQAKVSF